MNEEKVTAKYGSPVYLYYENILEQRTRDMMEFAEKLKSKTGIPEIKMHYSTKANGNLYMLKCMRNIGISVDAMSPAELETVQLAGFDKNDILYVCNNVSAEEMAEVLDKEIMLCLDSISQVEMLGECIALNTPRPEIMVRINPGTVGVGHSMEVVTSGEDTKFGVSEENIPELLAVAEKYGIKIIGLHQHLGSLFLNDKIDNYIEGVKAGLRIAKKYFKDLEIIDLGGGFGVPYKEDEESLNLDMLSDRLAPVLSDFAEEYHMVKFKFEPGRYIVCESGCILGTVNSVKNENGRVWIGTDIGMNVLMRPSLYDAYHKIEIIPATSASEEHITATIAGNICESGDVLGKDREVLKPKTGDIVKVYNAGAYGYSMASNYTGRPRPAEVMIAKNGEDILIRRRETVEDIISG